MSQHSPAMRRAVVSSVIGIAGTLGVIYLAGGVVWRVAHGGGSQGDFVRWVCFPILFFGLSPTLRLARRVWGAVIEWPAWRNRNADPNARVFRGHPSGRSETLHEQRARRYQAVKDSANRRWYWQVERGVKEIYGDEKPPENPEVPEWLKSAP